MSSVVYTLRSKTGDVLYVGCTMSLPNRLITHRRERDWWDEVRVVEVEHFDSRRDALARERDLIHSLKPPHNEIGAKPMQRTRGANRRPQARIDTPLRQAIKDAGLRHYEVAERVGVHETQLSYMVNGYAPDRETADRLASVLGRPVDVLFPAGIGVKAA